MLWKIQKQVKTQCKIYSEVAKMAIAVKITTLNFVFKNRLKYVNAVKNTRKFPQKSLNNKNNHAIMDADANQNKNYEHKIW